MILPAEYDVMTWLGRGPQENYADRKTGYPIGLYTATVSVSYTHLIDANIAFKFTDSKQPEYSIKEMYMISPLVPIYDDTRAVSYTHLTRNCLKWDSKKKLSAIMPSQPASRGNANGLTGNQTVTSVKQDVYKRQDTIHIPYCFRPCPGNYLRNRNSHFNTI